MKITIYRTAAVDPAILAEIPSSVIVHEGENKDLRWKLDGGCLVVYRGRLGYGVKPDRVMTWGYPLNAIDRFEVEE